LPTLTKHEEKRIIDDLLERSEKDQLTFGSAQSLACQLVTDIIKEKFDYEMSCVQIEWFYGR
jgi:5-formyltetrahydrofolate cyclo-ligase